MEFILPESELLYKYLTGELCDKGKDQLIHLLANSDDFRELFCEMTRPDVLCTELAALLKFNEYLVTTNAIERHWQKIVKWGRQELGWN